MKWMLPMTCLLAFGAPLSQAAVRGDKLPPPKSMSCLQMKQAISYETTRGLLNIPVDIELGRGAYVSEHEDANGVYYRAPSDALTEHRVDKKETSVAGRHITFEGGIYVPNDASAAPTLYEYYGTIATATNSVTDHTDCGALTYAVDPDTHKVNVWAVGAAAGIGAGLGMAIGRSVHPQMRGSYGQAAGVGLVGGLIGGLIVGAIEKSKAGEIIAGPTVTNEASEKIKALAAEKVFMIEREHSAASNIAAAAPVTSDTTGTAVGAPGVKMQANAGGATIMSTTGTPTAASTAATIAMPDSPMGSRAQSIANQLGCGAVKTGASGGYVAPCGSYGVFIDCDNGQCHPAHTVKLEETE